MIHLKRLYAHNFKQLQEIDLHFPDHARILVQGKNEAGKSTLFEAVFFALFGNALATESGTRNLDDLIRYGIEKTVVELDVQFGARLFKITRTITRGKSNTWELDIARDGDALEEIRGNTVVNKRLIAELGFDGDALLNTCFVEQKKLEKLEGMSRAKREESMAKLLNLDALVALESDLKIRGEDKQELERLRKRADLADIQAELPAHEKELAMAEGKLALIDLRGAVDGAVVELCAVQQLDAAIQTLVAQRDAVAQRVERIDALKQAMLYVKDARDAVERIADNAHEIERLNQEQAEARRAADQIPGYQARLARLRYLARLVQHLEQLRSARDAYTQRAAQMANVETRLADLNATIAREQDALAQADSRLHERTVSDAVGEWVATRRAVVTQDETARAVQNKLRARDVIARQFRTEMFAFAGIILALVAAAVVVPLWMSAFLGITTLTRVLLPMLFFAALAAIVIVVLAARALRHWREFSRAAEELGQAEGESRARAAASEGQSARLKEAEARLARLNIAIPESVESARVIASRPEEELRGARDATRERLLNARAVLGELQRQNQVGDGANIAGERVQCERAAQKAEALLTRRQSRAQTNAEALAVALDANAIQRARFQLDAELAQTQRRTNDAARLAQDITRREQQAQTFLVQARDAYERARALKPEARAWEGAFAPDAYTAFGKDLRAEYDVLGGEAVVKQAREIEGDLGRRQGERGTRARNAELLVAKTQELLARLGQAAALSPSPELREFEEVQGKLQSLDLGDEPTLRAQNRDLVGRVHSLRDRQAQLERELGLAGESLDRAVCRVEWEVAMRASRVRERGVEIVSLARRRIVQKVLPATMDYMRRILPTITRDRYHDAQLDSETYRIQVWDERGGAFKEKNIFSGGTRDQFSLALRLAFALATLPQERGSAPSFIFLDEPLGSFDDERAEALIYLLTEGEIARAFDQIFLISHVHVDERLFTHRVVLENGRIVSTDLP